MKSRYENDETLLYNVGHDVKDRSRKSPSPIPLSRLPLNVTAKRGDQPGSVVLIIERDPGAGLYEVQFCKGAPTGEDSWQTFGNFKKVRVFVPELERAGWYYFRVRSHGDNESSPWSAPVDIIVG